ncbi:MAG: hypothetical protein ACXABY_01770 [Candidatus Thorarchaeota archaeon]|jgi:hypothetical protein
MAREASVLVGSGLTPGLQTMPRNNTTQERHLAGTAVVVLNPEDNAIGGRLQVDQVSVGSSGVLPLPASGVLPYRRSIAIQNLGADTLYIGSTSGVTALTGFAIAINNTFSIECKNNVEIWAISDGTSDVRTIQASQIV